MSSQIHELKQSFSQDFERVKNIDELEQLRIKYLGRKAGSLTLILRGLKDIPAETQRILGSEANAFRQEIEARLDARLIELQSRTEGLLDVTLPGRAHELGHLHVVTKAIREISQIFERLGFSRVRYPEVEWDWYSFEALNMPPDHPARDEWETFFIDTEPIGAKGQRVLTPHTSSGQIREMEKGRLPIRMINISKCYRRQIDASHVPMFHQFEGLLIDTEVTISHLKGTLDYFVKTFFGSEREARIRPFHFQFTEPSFEVDISCGICKGHGCKMCKDGWLELGGAGMVHPNVIKAGGLDPKRYGGFAFGWGVERAYLMKAGLSIPDIRILYQNDLRFLKQF